MDKATKQLLNRIEAGPVLVDSLTDLGDWNAMIYLVSTKRVRFIETAEGLAVVAGK